MMQKMAFTEGNEIFPGFVNLIVMQLLDFTFDILYSI